MRRQPGRRAPCRPCFAVGLPGARDVQSQGCVPECAATVGFRRKLLRPLPRRCLVPRAVFGSRWPRIRQIVEQGCQVRCRFRLERAAYPIVELQFVDPALRHVFLQKSDRLVAVGISNSRFHRSPCRSGRLMLRRLLGGIRLGCGRLSHNHQYPLGHVRTKISRSSQTTRLAAWDRSQRGPRSTEVWRLIRG